MTDCIVELALLLQLRGQIKIGIGLRRVERKSLLPAQFGFVGMSELLREDAVIHQQRCIPGRELEPAAGELICLIEPFLLGQVSQPRIARGWISRVGLDRVLPGSDGVLGIALLQRLARQSHLERSVVRSQRSRALQIGQIAAVQGEVIMHLIDTTPNQQC